MRYAHLSPEHLMSALSLSPLGQLGRRWAFLEANDLAPNINPKIATSC